MAEYIEVTETYWSVCWKWIFPYPCRKSRKVMKWRYHFSYLNVSYRYIYSNYLGCEFNLKYKWRKWEWTGEGKDFTLYDYDMYFNDKKTDSGPCQPVVDPGPIL